MHDENPPIDPTGNAVSDPRHEQELTYALEWFKYHAEQRYKGFNIYVIQLFLGPIVTVAAAIIISAKSGNVSDSWIFFLILTIVGVFGLFCTGIFYGLDRRNYELVELGQNALRSIEDRFTQASSRILHNKDGGDEENKPTYSHSKLVFTFFEAGAAAFMLVTSVGAGGIIFIKYQTAHGGVVSGIIVLFALILLNIFFRGRLGPRKR